MLLRAGLPFRRLLLLSLVSGALGLGGAALGVGLSLGPVPLTPLVFGVTAGVFLYVALVDMVRCGVVQRNWGKGEAGWTRGASWNRLLTTGLQSLKDKGLEELGWGLLILPDTP